MSSILQLFECFAFAKNQMAELAPHHFTILEPIQFVRIDKIVLNCTLGPPHNEDYWQLHPSPFKTLQIVGLF